MADWHEFFKWTLTTSAYWLTKTSYNIKLNFTADHPKTWHRFHHVNNLIVIYFQNTNANFYWLYLCNNVFECNMKMEMTHRYKAHTHTHIGLYQVLFLLVSLLCCVIKMENREYYWVFTHQNYYVVDNAKTTPALWICLYFILFYFTCSNFYLLLCCVVLFCF